MNQSPPEATAIEKLREELHRLSLSVFNGALRRQYERWGSVVGLALVEIAGLTAAPPPSDPLKLREALPDPFREVLKVEWTGASRYTGYIAKSLRIQLKCGHELFRKGSQGIPKGRCRCRECGMIARGMIKDPTHG